MNLYRYVLGHAEWGKKVRGLGVYNPRKKRGSKTSWSIHASGRAIDFGVKKQAGDNLYSLLLDNAERLGLQQILWDDYGWDCRNGSFSPSAFMRRLHRDHIHLEMTEHAGRTLSKSAIVQIFGSDGNAAFAVVVDRGDKGNQVRKIQQLINGSGIINPVLLIDGDFGPSTEQAVKDFQKHHGLSVDGIVGPSTWAVLNQKPDPVSVHNAKQEKLASEPERPPSVFDPTVTQPVQPKLDPVARLTVEGFEIAAKFIDENYDNEDVIVTALQHAANHVRNHAPHAG